MPISIEKSYCLEPSNVTGTLQLSAEHLRHADQAAGHSVSDAHVYDRVRNFLCRRHNVSRRGEMKRI
jgi:hypothetical protein